jgi:hypothetical protein
MIDAWHSLWDSLSWMSPPLGLALGAGLVAALVYALISARPLRMVPLYWLLALAGYAAGQAIAAHGLRIGVVGDFALGTGTLACAVLFAVLFLVRLWYTNAHRRVSSRSRPALTSRGRVQR